tara:strand:+ start:78 stop:1316 length:1239 start_codon:yes stop_codon:yes gene_type:complete
MRKIIVKTVKCRLCNSAKLFPFLDLGNIPIRNAEINQNSKTVIPNLKILVCKDCWHVQAGKVPLPDFYVKDYTYHTRFSKSVDSHFKYRAKQIIKKFKLNTKNLIMDIGGNDGTFLKHFKINNKKLKNLCVDPTFKTTRFAGKMGIKIFRVFFNTRTSKVIKKKYGSPKIILCTNTFGAINDMNEFVNALADLMDGNSIFVYENPYLLDTFKGLQFDTMYYEHISYFSVSPMYKFFDKFGLEIFDYSKSKIHGGSMMVFVRKKRETYPLKKIFKILRHEKNNKFNTLLPYKNFSKRVKKSKKKINNILDNIKKNKKSIAAYGASDRGLTLLNYYKLNRKKIDYMIDVNTFKQGLYFSGTGMKIFSLKKLITNKPDYIFLTAWNFKNEIIKNLKKLGIKSKYIIPIPKAKIIK